MSFTDRIQPDAALAFPALREATPQQAQSILGRVVEEHSKRPSEGITPEELDKRLRAVEMEVPGLENLLKILALVAHQGQPGVRCVDESDRRILDAAEAMILRCYDQDACADRIADALKTAIYDTLRPGLDLERTGMVRAQQ